MGGGYTLRLCIAGRVGGNPGQAVVWLLVFSGKLVLQSLWRSLWLKGGNLGNEIIVPTCEGASLCFILR